MLGNETYQFAFTNLTGARFSVFATTNVSQPITNWTSIGPAIETHPGSGPFQSTHPDATDYNQRFCRLKSP